MAIATKTSVYNDTMAFMKTDCHAPIWSMTPIGQTVSCWTANTQSLVLCWVCAPCPTDKDRLKNINPTNPNTSAVAKAFIVVASYV